MAKNRSDNCRKWLENGMCALLPKYNEFGANSTEILVDNGEKAEDGRKLRVIINELTNSFQKDIRLVRSQASEELRQRAKVPLNIDIGVVFLPFKVRRPIGKDDGSIGFILESALVSLNQQGSGSSITLKGGHEIRVFESIKTSRKLLDNAQRVKRAAIRYSVRQEQLSAAWNQLLEEYEQPATRGDIAILTRNLMNLIDKLGI